MIYPKNTIEQKLGFDRIRVLLKEACISSLGARFVDELQFYEDYEIIKRKTGQTAEFVQILEQQENFPSQNYIDVSNSLNKAKIQNTFLDEKEFFDLKLSLKTIDSCLKFFQERQDAYPLLSALSLRVEFSSFLIYQIEQIIDDRGKVRNTASPELNVLRKAIIDGQNRLRRRLDQILRMAKQNGFSKDDANITIRDGRLVIPVAAEHKRKIKGFVHSESATGQTVFLEPTEILDINNEVKELEYKEKREVMRILLELTDKMRPHIEILEKAYFYLGKIDFIRAKAKFALKINAINPISDAKSSLKIREARHPLLWLNFQEQGREVVPLSLEINTEQRIIVISGPNAGGKSVALKTIGLLQYMFQSGLLVTVKEDSQMGVFKDIFIDIGDEQSLENDLSTYSSHLNNMKYLLRIASKNTLFLIDEFGAGTEPIMGAAISEAMLEELHQSKSFGIITTHYTNLKSLAEETEGLVNAGMRFDSESLIPLYKLETGRPGSSFAFEVAKKIGLPPKLIEKSRKKVGEEQVKLDQILLKLEKERIYYENKNQEMKVLQEEMTQTTQDYGKLRDYLGREKKKLLNKAKQEAKEIIKQANQQIEQTIREIRESQADKEKTKELRNDLQNFSKELKPELIEETPEISPKNEEDKIEVIGGKIEEGDAVRIKGQNAIAEVLNIRGKDVELIIGELKTTVKINRLEKINRKIRREIERENRKSRGFDTSEKMINFNPRLDIRGKRAEEVFPILNQFMDDALLLNQNQLYIVHGKGDGVLRKIVRDELRQYAQVKSMKDEHADRGGDGVTIVMLS